MSDALIPPTVLDNASQRIFVLSLFALIQSWKIYDLVLLKSSEGIAESLSSFSFFVKYAVLDGVLLWSLPVLNIPRMRPGALKTLAITLSVYAATFAMMSSVTAPAISSVVVPLWRMVAQKKEMSLLGNTVDLSRVVDMDSHFRGKVTIHYLPDSSARFNPFAYTHACVEQGQAFYMPIEFNTTSELGLLQVQKMGEEPRVTTYTGSTLRKLLKADKSHLAKNPRYKHEDHITYVEVPLDGPGVYKLGKVADAHKNQIRTYKGEFVVSPCPDARFAYPPNYQRKYKCLGSTQGLELPLVEYGGVLPATFSFQLQIGGREWKSFDVEVNEGNSEVHFTRNLLERYLIANPHILDGVPPGLLEFRLNSVKDVIGNTKRYNPASRDADIWFDYEMRVPNTIGLQSDAQKMLVGGSKQIHLKGTLKENDYPVKVAIQNGEKRFNVTFSSPSELRRGITVDQPGTYTLVEAADVFCACRLGTKTVSLELAEPPSVNITAKAIEDKCLGTTGYTFALDLRGKAPFYVQYHVYRRQASGALNPVQAENGRTARFLKADAHTYTFKFSPQAEGNYVIVFNDVKDAHYSHQGIRLDESRYTYSTYFQLASTATLGPRREISTCYGETAQIPVHLKGNGPFSFTYELVKGGKRVRREVVEKVDEYVIRTPMDLAGTYEIRLIEARDRAACRAVIDSSGVVVVRSRNDVPSIQLMRSKPHRIVEGGSVQLPLKWVSSQGRRANDEVKYILRTPSGETQVHTLAGDAKSITATAEGVYSLLSYTNGGCVGTIAANNSVEVMYYARPTLRVVSNAVESQQGSVRYLSPVCQGGHRPVRLELTGEAPFVVDYRVTMPNGRTEKKAMSVEGRSVEIELPTNEAGLYEHEFVGIYDKRYERSPSQVSTPALVRYSVLTRPDVVFGPARHMCQLESDGLLRIPATFTGQYPFTVRGTLVNGESEQSIVLEDIVEPFVDVAAQLGIGNYVFRVDELVDGNGCVRRDVGSTYSLTVSPVPDVRGSSRTHYCVGDHVAYNLTGSPPFTVTYSFNGRRHQARNVDTFSRLAAKPGVLEVQGIQDDRCAVSFDSDRKDLSLVVHDLPSVAINKGDSIIEDIHEGDQVELRFLLEGVPPFSLTYTRSLGGEVVEKHTVGDITEHEHVVLVNLEGTYEAVEIRDRYCRAKR